MIPAAHRNKIILPFVVLAACSTIVLLLVAFKPSPPVKTKSVYEYGVSVIDLTKGDYHPLIPLYGVVESPMNANLTAAISSDVDSVLVKEGDMVEQGQLLVQLDPVDFELNLSDREADLSDIIAQINTEKLQFENNKTAIKNEKVLLDLANEQLKRSTKLYKKNLGSESDFEQAKSAVERQQLSYNSRKLAIDMFELRLDQLKAKKTRAEAAVQRAIRDLERASILAPFSGRIASVYVSAGDRVNPGARAVSIYSLDQLEVRADINSTELPIVRSVLERGDQLGAVGLFEGNDRVELVLDRLSGVTERGRAGVAGLFKITGGAEHLTLGRFLEFELTLPVVSGVYSIPMQAIYGRDRIYIAEDGVMNLVYIDKLGQHRHKGGELMALIMPKPDKNNEHDDLTGKKVVVTQIPNAIQGLPVNIINTVEMANDKTQVKLTMQ